MKKTFLLVLCLFLGAALFVYAQTEDDGLGDLDDLDSMFEDSGDIEEISEEDASKDLSTELLEDDNGMRWSGNFTGHVDLGFSWYNFLEDGIFRKTDNDTFDPEVGATLRFNARPNKNFRVSGKFWLTISPEDLGLFQNEDPDPMAEDQVYIAEDMITIEELFADFNYREKLFFRFGKSFIKWGKGYFWSPADILNLQAINAEDPEDEREGPVNLKVNFPFGSNNLNIYVLLNDVEDFEYTGFAGNVEFLVGDYEIGFGGYYQYDQKPRIVGVFSGSIGKIGIFGEAALAFGSEKTHIREAAGHTPAFPVFETYTNDSDPVFFGTIGAMYLNTEHNFTIIGQYYYNGDGCPNTEYDNGQSMYEYAMIFYGLGDLTAADLVNFGQHYLGLSVNFAEIADSDFSLLSYVLLSMSDWSGIAAVTLSFEPFERFVVKLTPRMMFGQDGDEFLPVTDIPNPMNPLTWLQQPVFGFTLSFSFGEEDF
ncbi:MAG: hypothetical protein JW874_14930 [Spirochaetales bacterium]|nr:hypothetical protein [Spirochaetales bacterium]